MRTFLATLLVTVALAGCLGGTTSSGVVVEDAAWVNPVILEHDHSDPYEHDLQNNMSLISHLDLGGPGGSISEMDVAGSHVFVGVMGHGFAIVNMSDPTDPILASSVAVATPDQFALGAYIADLKVDAAGDWVFVALELSTTPGVMIYDARDKSNPVLAGFWPEPGILAGCHMIEYAIISEVEYLFCAPLDNAVYVGRILPEVGGAREIVQVARWMPTTEKFVSQQAAAAQEHVSEGNILGAGLHFFSGHQDMTYQTDPLTGTPLLTVSFWNLGLRFVDVSDPTLPREIGSWAGESSELWDGALHTSMLMESEGRRIAVTIPEGSRPPALFILDVTDFDNPELITEWTAVPDFMGEDNVYSLHNFQIADGKVYLAHYHGGIWVLDISTPELQANPHALGTYLPWNRETGDGCCGGSWDVVLAQGYVLTANRGGLFVAHLEGDEVGPDAVTSFA